MLEEYYQNEAEKAFKEMKRLKNIISNNPNMSSKKSEIINKLIELYDIKELYYSNKIFNPEKSKLININLLNSSIDELEKMLRDQEGSSMFITQKTFAKLLTFLAQLHAGNNSKKLKNDINQLLKALHKSKQISKLVYENLIAAI